MKLRFPAAAFALPLLLILTPAPPPLVGAEPPAVSAAEIQNWIRQLGSDRFLVREDATSRLARAGRAAIQPLADAVKQGDREVASRGVFALQRLGLDGDETQQVEAFQALEAISAAQIRAASNLAKTALDQIAEVRQQAAINALTNLGARVDTDYRQISGTAQIYAHSIQIDETWRGAEQDLEQLRWLRDIQQVALVGPQVTDDWFKYIGRMRNLAYLVVKRATITDRSMHHIAGLNSVNAIELKYVPISDASIRHLATLVNATSVKLYGTEVSKEGALRLQQVLAGAEIDHRAGAFLGVGCRPHPLGCEIGQVHPGSAAHKAGIEPGDIMIRYDGHVVLDFETLTKFIGRHKVDHKVSIQLARRVQTMVLTLRGRQELGVEGKTGLLGYEITKVEKGSTGHALGLRAGDVIFRVGGDAISDADSLKKALQVDDNASPLIHVARGAELFSRDIVLGEWD